MRRREWRGNLIRWCLPPFISRLRAGGIRALARSFFPIAASSIYPGVYVLHDDQEAGCVEQPRHIRLLQNGAGNFGRVTCFFPHQIQSASAAGRCPVRCWN